MRFSLGRLMFAAAASGGLFAMFTPELRNFDRAAQGILLLAVGLFAFFAVCFAPWWLALLRLRNRIRSGSRVGWPEYVRLLTAFLLSLVLALSSMLAAVWLGL